VAPGSAGGVVAGLAGGVVAGLGDGAFVAAPGAVTPEFWTPSTGEPQPAASTTAPQRKKARADRCVRRAMTPPGAAACANRRSTTTIPGVNRYGHHAYTNGCRSWRISTTA
jgi:hypothetical protein